MRTFELLPNEIMDDSEKILLSKEVSENNGIVERGASPREKDDEVRVSGH